MKWSVWVRCILVALTILTIAFIFSNSLEDSSTSASTSESVGEVIEDAVNNVVSGGTIHRGDEGFIEIPLKIIRDLAHVSEFVCLGFLLLLTHRSYGSRLSHVYLPVLVGSSVALTDEIIQIFVPGRAFELTDWMLDDVGVLIGTLIGVVLGYLILKPKTISNTQD